MLVVDANVLIYACNEAEPRHVESREWLDAALSAHEPVGFAWTVLLAYPAEVGRSRDAGR